MTADRGADRAAARAVAAARGWIGTPWAHGASLRGRGCDCLGLVRGVWREVAGAEPWAMPEYGADWTAGRGAALAEAMARHFLPGRGGPGEVALLRLRPGGAAQHLGIVTEGGIVHAYGRHGVVESPLGAALARRIVARFGFP